MIKSSILLAAVSTLALACAAVCGGGPNAEDLTPYAIGDSDFPFGDSIVISELHSTSGDFAEGAVLTIKGTYNLKSQYTATLYLGTTGTTRRTTRNTGPTGNTVSISRGSGIFELTHTVPVPGYPHLTFYNQTTGAPFGGFYFGSGDTLKDDGTLKYDR